MVILVALSPIELFDVISLRRGQFTLVDATVGSTYEYVGGGGRRCA